MKKKYRWRTAIRKKLPTWLGFLSPKGEDPCGQHELYTAECSPGGGAKVLRCKHCNFEKIDTTTVNAERARLTPRPRLRSVR